MGEMKIIALNQQNPPLRHSLKVKLGQRETEEMMEREGEGGACYCTTSAEWSCHSTCYCHPHCPLESLAGRFCRLF